MPGFWISTRSISPPRVPTTVLTVFSCVASRNKRGKRALDGTDWGLRTRAYIRFPILILRFACRAGRTPRTASFADSLYLQNRQQLPYFELNPAVRRTARAGRLPLGRPATFASSLRAPGHPPRQNNAPFTGQSCQVRPAPLKVARVQPIRPRRAPHAPLMRRPRRGRRFHESRYSLSPQSPANGSAQSTAQIQAPCSAQRGAKTCYGFRARRIVAA